MDRIINYHFYFLLAGIFVFATGAGEHRQIIIAAILSVFFCFAAYLSGALSLDGTAAAIVAGIYILGLGGIPATIMILLFFLSGSLISISGTHKEGRAFFRVRRSGLQVWANSFWFVLFLALAVIWNVQMLWVGALGALATAMADTWATELGSRRFNNYNTYLITTFKKVKAGTDGGVSIPGFIAAFVASLLFSLIAVYVFSLQLPDLLCIFIAGFSGCLIDSYFGADLQGKDKAVTIPSAGDSIQITIDNNTVNMLSTGAGSLIAIILKLFFL